jgi:hypothetical protein
VQILTVTPDLVGRVRKSMHVERILARFAPNRVVVRI